MRTITKAGLAAAFGMLATPALAQGSGIVQADLNMRAGPSTEFPVVTTIPEETRVTVHGCIQARNWCDVSFRGERGWVSAQYLGYRYQERVVPIYDYYEVIEVPFITFTFGDYWDRHYRGRPWYDRRDRWRVIWRDEDRDRDRDREGRREEREERAERREERRERAEDREQRQERRERAKGREQRQERRERAESREQRQERAAERGEQGREQRQERAAERREQIRERRPERAAERRGDGERPAIGRGMSPGERGGAPAVRGGGPGAGPALRGGGAGAGPAAGGGRMGGGGEGRPSR